MMDGISNLTNQNVTTERFEDFDGERWIMPED